MTFLTIWACVVLIAIAMAGFLWSVVDVSLLLIRKLPTEPLDVGIVLAEMIFCGFLAAVGIWGLRWL